MISTFKYDFTVKHVAGKKNLIADYLSRNPLWEDDEDAAIGPTVTNDFGQEVTIGQHVHMAGLHQYAERIYNDPLLEDLRDAGVLDTSYLAVIDALRKGMTKEAVLSTTENPCREYSNV